MSYFKIGNNDYSSIVCELKVANDVNYNAQTNANGDTVVEFINSKRTIEVGIIAIDSDVMKNLQADISAFNVSISFRNPNTGELETDVNCIIPSNEVEYYTIQANKVLFNAFNLTFIEL